MRLVRLELTAADGGILVATGSLIKDSSYRLVVAVDYRHQIVFIKWLGTHAEYDRIDVKTVKYGD